MRAIPTLSLLAAVLFSSVSHAQPSAEPADLGLNDARERFRRGVELYREGSFDAALAEFNKAHELAPNYRVLYNLAQVQTERHDYVAALKLLKDYLAQGGSEIPADRREQVEKDLLLLKSRVAALWVQSDVAGAEIVLDGVPVGTLPLKSPVLVNVGVHQLQLRKAGYITGTRTLSIAGNETVRLEVAMQSEQTLTAHPSTAAPRPRIEPFDGSSEPGPARASGSNTPLWISLISTAVLAASAVTFGVLARSSDKELDRELDRLPADRARIDDTRAEVKRNAALTDGLAAGAVVAAGLSLYFALSGSSSPESAQEVAATGVRVTPADRGLRVIGEF